MDVKFSNNGEIDVVEVTRPDGSVVALPAENVNGETGLRYCDMFPGEYAAFKRPPEEDGAAAHEPVVGEAEEHA